MSNYLLINTLLTLCALSINHWMQIPHRIRFRIMMLALVAWLLPLGLISIELTEAPVNILPLQSLQIYTPLESIATNHYFDFKWLNLFGLLMFLGALRFTSDVFKTRKLSQNLKTQAYQHQNNIRFAQGISGAFVTGYFKPIIWIDEKHRDTEELRSIITHEQQHINNHDQFWLILITMIQRLFWFNPMVLVLCKKTRHSIELSCDEACRNTIGKSKYQLHLAKLIIHQPQEKKALFNNHIHSNANFNLHRIKQLYQENTMNRFQTSKLSLILLITLMMSTYSLITVADNAELPELSDQQILLELQLQKNQQQAKNIKLITPAGEAAQVIYENHQFSFKPQRVTDQPKQIYTEVLINRIDASNHTEVARPAVISTVGQMAGIKFDNQGTNFKINITAHTNTTMEQPPVAPVANPVPAPVSPAVATTAPAPPTVQLLDKPSTPSPAPVPASPPKPKQAPVKNDHADSD